MATRDPRTRRYRIIDPSLLVGGDEKGEGAERPRYGDVAWRTPDDAPRIFDPAVLADEEAHFEDPGLLSTGPMDSAVHLLTWVVLAVCLGLWAVVGFVLWVPLLVRAILSFSLSLSQSMLVGDRPYEAGRILMDSVGFYRRGFSVAVSSIRGRASDEERPTSQGLSAPDLAFEIIWAGVVWYVILSSLGIIPLSPVDLWNNTVELLTSGLGALDRLLMGGGASTGLEAVGIPGSDVAMGAGGGAVGPSPGGA